MASPRNRLYGAEVVLSLWACTAGPALAQSGACVLSPDKRNPSEQILRCGSELKITPAPGTQYHPASTRQDGVPSSVQLDSGALLIEFHANRRRGFQILTPATIASVRGTKWATEVKPGQSSTLVLEGRVTVRRLARRTRMSFIARWERPSASSRIAALAMGWRATAVPAVRDRSQ
jgi:hypothetical protein